MWQVRTLRGHTSEVRSVAFSADGQRIVSGSEDRRVKIWNAETGAEVRSLWECDEGGDVAGVFSRGFSRAFVGCSLFFVSLEVVWGEGGLASVHAC